MATLSMFGAVVAGLAGSLHCFAMCGPLACAGCARSGGRRPSVIAAWHLARIAAYALLGGLFGLAGEGAMSVFSVAAPKWLPWAVAGLLAASALGLGDWMPRVPGISAALRQAHKLSASLAPVVRAGAMGALTPLLPCGLLYALFGGALATGSLTHGFLLAAGFALGGVPALLAAQAQSLWLQKLPRGSEFILRRAVPIVAAVVIVVRATHTHGCPLCP